LSVEGDLALEETTVFQVVKTTCERVLALVVLLLVSVPMILIGLAIALTSGRPVFFRQRRVGRYGDEFTMLKYRTMWGSPSEYGEADAAWYAATLGEDVAAPPDRCTRLGRLLRATSLDELPQLFNVIRGDMS